VVLKTGGEGAIAVDFTAAEVRLARFASGGWKPVLQPPPAASGEPVRQEPDRQVASVRIPR